MGGGAVLCCGVGGSQAGGVGGGGNGGGVASRLLCRRPDGERGSFQCLRWGSEGGGLFIFNLLPRAARGMTFFILVVTVGG